MPEPHESGICAIAMIAIEWFRGQRCIIANRRERHAGSWPVDPVVVPLLLSLQIGAFLVPNRLTSRARVTETVDSISAADIAHPSVVPRANLRPRLVPKEGGNASACLTV
ncbi:hypothetical protein Bxe_B0133 [Paraburkholderia xenovorans LB400]|uniref:Uncharacterized protein n=1 Tax=Paraburkholderia xenovorans (strain LB400) TaxID=266265 RepID=Q13JD4_PARXL|nr:hypothetical protein Bxe_B0133 [Paraburkholderia xenovorans LB400]